jgi:integrase
MKLTKPAQQLGRKGVNPARFLRMPKEDNARFRYLNQYKPLPTKVEYLKECQTEEDRLRAVIRTEHPNHLLEFEITLATGTRRSEMYRATWPNVTLEHSILTVPRSKHGETRHVTLNSDAKTMLEFLKEKASESEYVFLSMRSKEPLTGNRHWFEDAVKKAGVKDFTWHCLRHTFGSRFAMTVRYSHLSQPDLRAAVEQLVPSGKRTATTTATGEQGHSADSSIEAKEEVILQ